MVCCVDNIANHPVDVFYRQPARGLIRLAYYSFFRDDSMFKTVKRY